jgi:hypothetical protein
LKMLVGEERKALSSVSGVVPRWRQRSAPNQPVLSPNRWQGAAHRG